VDEAIEAKSWSQVEVQWHFSSVIRVVLRLIYSAIRSDKCLFLHDHQEKPSWSDIGLVRMVNLLPYIISQAISWSQVEVQWHFSSVMDHSPINQNFDLNKSRQNSIAAWKSITKLVIFQSFVAKCCKMRII
jgi:hypothetical protein